MALGATHIRFAKDLKEKYGVLDMRKYISGTLYPDSRYMTGIDRAVTHPADVEGSFFESSDFRKGWRTHLLCDTLQYQVTKEWIPEVFEGKKVQGGEVWVRHTALKVLQDMDDIRKFGIKEYLPFLDYVEAPNGEPQEVVRKYNQIYADIYSNPNIGIAELCELWRRWGMKEDILEAIRKQSETYASNKEIMNSISKIYPEMLVRVNQQGS